MKDKVAKVKEARRMTLKRYLGAASAGAMATKARHGPEPLESVFSVEGLDELYT